MRQFKAAREGEFVLYYQPIAEAGLVHRGAEALIRWKHPTWEWCRRCSLSPLPRTGLINLLGAWALKAAGMRSAIQAAAGRGLSISVNISPCQFPQRLPSARRALTRPAPGQRLELEITEGTLMVDPAHGSGQAPRWASARRGSRSTISAPATRRWRT